MIFERMKCIQIGLFNMEEITHLNEYNDKHKLDLLNKIKINWCQPFTKYDPSLIHVVINITFI